MSSEHTACSEGISACTVVIGKRIVNPPMAVAVIGRMVSYAG